MSPAKLTIFSKALGQSVMAANSQVPVLLKVMAFLFAYLLKDILIISALFILGYLAGGKTGIVLDSAAILYLVLALVKFNGALGLVFTYLSVGENQPRVIAAKSIKKAFSFFFNALGTGVLILFGQLLIVCPCFLLLNDFIFSPFLFVYENLQGKYARERSREIAASFGWIVLSRTSALMIFSYISLGIAVLAALAKLWWFTIFLVAAVSIYLGLIQSNFIFNLYQETLALKNVNSRDITSAKFRFLTILSIFIIIIIYLFYKLLL